jgi:predicted nucleic acid-binding protein
MKKELEGDCVFDASVLVDLIFSTKRGLYLRKKLVNESVNGYASEIALVELKYVLCRKTGWKKAKEVTDNLIDSGYIIVKDLTPILDLIARYKCERKISLGDCSTIALSKYLSTPALFSKREEDLIRELTEKLFDIELLFLEDFTR